MIVAVHGATGVQGLPVVRRLLDLGHRVRALSRGGGQGLPAAAEQFPVDLADAAGLALAYRGVDAVAVVLPGGAPPDRAVAQARAVLEALSVAGVPRAVFNASGGVWTRPPGVAFLDARTVLAAGLAGVVRSAVVAHPAAALMDNHSEAWVVRRLQETGELVHTAGPDDPMRPVAMADVAVAVVEALQEVQPPARVVVHGPNQVTGREIAQRVGEHLRREVRWTTLTPEEYLAGVARALGEQYAANIGELYGRGSTIPPPDPPPPDSRHVVGHTRLTAWIAAQEW